MVGGGQQSSMTASSAPVGTYVAERHRHGDDHHTDDVRRRLSDQEGDQHFDMTASSTPWETYLMSDRLWAIMILRVDGMISVKSVV